jgi:hypothetical protein
MSSNDTFQEYKVKHLFLLVGENPLPNYVAAMKLLGSGGTVYLVYTNQTLPQKKLLQNALTYKGFSSKPVALDKDKTDNNKSNAHLIYTKVKEDAEKIPINERIGLHYTGGTNTMAVHAYRAIADLKRTDTVYSYLDAKTLEIFIDHPNCDSTHRAVQLTVPLEVLFKLHKYEWQEDKKPLPAPILPDAAAEFVRLYQDDKIAETWRKWCKEELNKKAKNSEGWWVDDEITLILRDVHKNIIEVLQKQEYKHFFAINGKQIKIQKSPLIDSMSKVYAWLSGCWLEHYVLQQVKELTKNLQLGESKMSFVIKKSQSWEGGVFEFDVAFMRSYQLFAISCTTSKDPKECKLKLFEAYTRAKQLGGDEARVALVCCCDDDTSKSQRLDRYLKSQLEGAVTNPKIAVFIRQDLPSLKEKIADWIELNKGAS